MVMRDTYCNFMNIGYVVRERVRNLLRLRIQLLSALHVSNQGSGSTRARSLAHLLSPQSEDLCISLQLGFAYACHVPNTDGRSAMPPRLIPGYKRGRERKKERERERERVFGRRRKTISFWEKRWRHRPRSERGPRSFVRSPSPSLSSLSLVSPLSFSFCGE